MTILHQSIKQINDRVQSTHNPKSKHQHHLAGSGQ